MHKNSIRKMTYLILIAGMMLSALPIPGFAANDNTIGVNVDPEPNVIERGEVVQYYYRLYNGKQQYRIWSLTLMEWKTDWIDC